jgi:tRNASer (uridine44-2'-O)-methyltransferase
LIICPEGRKRIGTTEEEGEKVIRNALEIVESVRERGIFKTRRPEGKAGDH